MQYTASPRAIFASRPCSRAIFHVVHSLRYFNQYVMLVITQIPLVMFDTVWICTITQKHSIIRKMLIKPTPALFQQQLILFFFKGQCNSNSIIQLGVSVMPLVIYTNLVFVCHTYSVLISIVSTISNSIIHSTLVQYYAQFKIWEVDSSLFIHKMI